MIYFLLSLGVGLFFSGCFVFVFIRSVIKGLWKVDGFKTRGFFFCSALLVAVCFQCCAVAVFDVVCGVSGCCFSSQTFGMIKCNICTS